MDTILRIEREMWKKPSRNRTNDHTVRRYVFYHWATTTAHVSTMFAPNKSKPFFQLAICEIGIRYCLPVELVRWGSTVRIPNGCCFVFQWCRWVRRSITTSSTSWRRSSRRSSASRPSTAWPRSCSSHPITIQRPLENSTLVDYPNLSNGVVPVV